MRAAIFIDGGYILNQLKAARIDPDYSALADYLLEPLRESVPLDLLRCYYYYCPPWMSAEPTEGELRRMEAHEEFVEEIESLDRWAVRLGKLQKRRDGGKDVFEQKRVDVLLSCDLVRHAAAGHIQHAILLAGDSDFIPAVAAAQDSGVTLTLYCGTQNTVHNDLMVVADEVHQLDWKTFPKLKKTTKGATAKKTAKPKATAVKKQKSTTRNSGRKKKKSEGFDPAAVEAMKEELGFTSRIKKALGRQ